jgi:hypothetical protein
MKFIEKNIMSILLIILLGMSNISSTSLTIKSRSHKSKRRSHEKNLNEPTENSLGNAKKILTQITEGIKKGSQIAFFIMGFLSVWVPKFEQIYLKIKTIKNFFRPCAKFLKTLWSMYEGNIPSPETDPEKIAKNNKEKSEILENIAESEAKIEKSEKKDEETRPEEKKKICRDTKKKLERIYKKCLDDIVGNKHNEKSAIIGGLDKMEPDRFCNYALHEYCEKSHKMIKKNFETTENYLEICMHFRQTGDCETYNEDDKGAWHFIKKTLKYGLFMKQGATCVLNLLKKGGKDESSGTPENQEVKTMTESALGVFDIGKLVLEQLGSTLLHLITFGIWGALKAAWNVIKLTLAIYLLVKNFIEDLPFNIGKLVGLSINIVKSFLIGRRRKR